MKITLYRHKNQSVAENVTTTLLCTGTPFLYICCTVYIYNIYIYIWGIYSHFKKGTKGTLLLRKTPLIKYAVLRRRVVSFIPFLKLIPWLWNAVQYRESAVTLLFLRSNRVHCKNLEDIFNVYIIYT